MYWKNGTPTLLPSPEGVYSVTGIAVDGSDVYVSGASYTSNPGGPIATYWKNGVAVLLSSNVSYANAIAVANGNVYVAGIDEGPETAVLWTNGTPTGLLDGNYPGTTISVQGIPYSIAISGSDVYVAGTIGKSFETSPDNYWNAQEAVYWKNGSPVELTQISNNSPNIWATSITLSGSDVYVSGYSAGTTAATSSSLYWKNGTQTVLGPIDLPTSIAVSGTDIYVAGYLNSVAIGYWKNGTPVPLGGGVVNQIAVNGTDVYMVSSSTDYATTGIWKNGVYTAFDTDGSGDATSIFLAPQQE